MYHGRSEPLKGKNGGLSWPHWWQAPLNFDTKIPVLIDLNEQLRCSKLISNNMLVKYEDTEEYEEWEVTIIARIISSGMVKLQKAFCDPLKNFMTLNRVMRRSIEGRTDGLNERYADKDYRIIEILVIYQ